jgi:transcriptional regulator with XRE-family HTH domain
MDPKQFGDRLKDLRERAGVTQRELAARAGLGQKTISNWEQGISEPVWSNVLALAKALGLDCRAFEQEPAPRPKTGRGRPPKATPASPPAGELEATAKRPRGRQGK